MSKLEKELKQYYELREIYSSLYDYDQDGNLVEKNKENEVIKTIPLPVYRFPTFEEYDEMEEKRKKDIAEASNELNEAKKRLRSLYLQNASKDAILKQNQKTYEADVKLQNIRYPLKFVDQRFVKINTVDFSNPRDSRNYPYKFAFLETSPFTLQDKYVRVGSIAKKPLISVDEAKQQINSNIPVILFWEPETNDYGFLSLSWPIELEYNGTSYHSVKQAIYAEIAKSFNDQKNLEKIMLTDSPDLIDYNIQDIPGDKDVNLFKWNQLMNKLLLDINLIKFKKYPELSLRLLQTNNAKLGAYLPNDNQIGIGISLDNEKSKNSVNWTGQNLLGKALMDIRDQLRAEQAIAIQPQQEKKMVRKLRMPIATKKKTTS